MLEIDSQVKLETSEKQQVHVNICAKLPSPAIDSRAAQRVPATENFLRARRVKGVSAACRCSQPFCQMKRPLRTPATPVLVGGCSSYDRGQRIKTRNLQKILITVV